MVTADPLTLLRFVCGMGELSGKTNKAVKRLFQVKLTFFATLPHASHPAGVKKPPRWAVCSWGSSLFAV